MMILLGEKIRYPQKNDKFFIEKGKQDELAFLGKTFQEFGNYADSYQTGAISLINLILADIKLKDYLIYPAIFLIRHYIELRLKELIQSLNFCITTEKLFPTHHDILNLWNQFKNLYSSIGENVNDPRFLVVDDLISEMSLVDPISMSFRYPVDKLGQKTQKLESVNVTNLRETFVRLCFLFNGISMQITQYVSINEEMLQNVYHNYWL